MFVVRGAGYEGHARAENGSEAGHASCGFGVGMGGSQEAAGEDHQGGLGVSPGVGTSLHHSGAVGAASSGDYRMEHGGGAADHQGGSAKGGALHEGPGEYSQVHSEGQGDEASRRIAPHGP